MRVYIYTLRYVPVSGGGSHHSLEIFIEALRQAGHTPILTTYFSADNNYREKPCEMREENYSGGFIALQKHIAKEMQENSDAGVHHLYGPSVMWAGGMYKKSGGKTPVVVSINNFTPGMGFIYSASSADHVLQRSIRKARFIIHRLKWLAWEKVIGVRLMREVDQFLCDSLAIQEFFREFGYTPRTYRVLPAPIELPTDKQSISPFNDDEKSFRVLFAGRLIKEKGPDLVLNAALQLPKSIHVHIVGKGSEEEALKNFVRKNNLSSRVFFHGWMAPEKMPDFYKNAHVLAHPSLWLDPFSRIAVDALACGLPVIATNNATLAWIVGDAGITFPRGAVSGLVKSILFFYENPDKRGLYATRARARARIFESGAVSREFVKILESLANKS